MDRIKELEQSIERGIKLLEGHQCRFREDPLNCEKCPLQRDESCLIYQRVMQLEAEWLRLKQIEKSTRVEKQKQPKQLELKFERKTTKC